MVYPFGWDPFWYMNPMVCTKKSGTGFLVPGMVFLVPVVFFSPECCFQFPEGSVVPRVFSVPGLGCFQFPARGDGMAVFVVPVRCFFLFLLASLLFFVRCFFPFFLLFISSASALLPVIFVSLPPFLPSFFPFSSCASFNLPSVLPFLASCPCFLPFPFLSFPFRPLPEFPSRTFPSLP